jgi:hypothetical protein
MRPRCSRRSAVRLGSVAVLGSLSGCSAFQSDDAATVTVSEIELRNRLEREIDVSVLLLDGGDVAYWRTVSVGAPPSPFAALDDLPSEPGEYVLYAQVPSTDADEPVRADLTEASKSRSCITVHMAVTRTESNGDQHPSVTYGSVGRC